MENETHNSETNWLDQRMGSLDPPPEWRPDSDRAYAQLLKRRQTEASPRWMRFSLAAAILVSTCGVLVLLPWHALWNPAIQGKRIMAEPVKAEILPAVQSATPVPAPPAPQQPPAAQAEPGAPPAAAAPAPEQQGLEEKPVEEAGKNGVTGPSIISPIEPGYTDEARKAHIQGLMIMNIIIRADGTAKVVKIIQGLGYGLDELAVATVERWQCKPGTKDGKPVDVQVRIAMNFHLY